MKAENEEIKISSYGLHEMEESATQISIKGEEEMSRELIREGLEFIGINEWSNLLTNGINMNDIALKYVQLLAADHVSELMINQLRLDGIYTIQNSPVICVNIVLVSTETGVGNVLKVVQEHQSDRRNVVIKITSEISIPDEPHIDAILEFQQGSKPYPELKRFLRLYKENVEKRSLLCYDFRDFFMLIRGRNVISIVSYEYRENITEALDQLKSVKTHEGVRYLLYFSVDKCDNDEIGNRQASIRDFMDAFPCENITYWNIGESSSQIVALFASIPIE